MGDEVEVEAPEPAPPLAAEELEGRQELFTAVFADPPFAADALKLGSIKERTPAAPPPPGDDEPPADEEGGASAGDAFAQAQAKAKSLMYSEVPFEVMHNVLNEIKSQDLPLFPGKGLFTDLGSGAGKSCIAAALLHPFEKVVGIECLSSLADAGTAALAKYAEAVMPEGVPKPEVSLQKGDFVADFEGVCEPIASQTVVALAVATAYIADQIGAICNFANKMPDGSYFITFGQGLPDHLTFGLNRHPDQRRAVAVKKALAKRGSDPSKIEIPEPTVYDPVGWVEVSANPVEMDWGTSKVFIYKKIPNPFFEGWATGEGRSEGPWEQLKDLLKEEAEAKLKEARPELKIELLALEAGATAEAPAGEPDPERVIIRFDPETNLVNAAPVVG